MKVTQTEKKDDMKKIHVIIDAKYAIGLDNGSNHVLGEEDKFKNHLKIFPYAKINSTLHYRLQCKIRRF